jgi:hypothetical protein
MGPGHPRIRRYSIIDSPLKLKSGPGLPPGNIGRENDLPGRYQGMNNRKENRIL